MFEHFATLDRSPARRLDCWNELVAGLFEGMSVSAQPEIDAGWSQCWLGDVGLALARSQKSIVSRWVDSLPVARSGRLVLHLQHGGVSRTEQRHQAAVLCAGDMTLCRPDEPYQIHISDRNEMFVLNCPESLLDGIDPAPAVGAVPVLGRHIPAVGLLHDFVGSLFRQQWSAAPDAAEAAALSDVLMRLARYAVAGQSVTLDALPGMRARVLAFVEQHLCDSGLRTGVIAQRLSLSVRSVQGIFADMATTPTAFITDRRLAVAADMIRGGRDYGTITDLAHQLGFCDAAHFARRFRSRFGMSPGAFVRHCRELH